MTAALAEGDIDAGKVSQRQSPTCRPRRREGVARRDVGVLLRGNRAEAETYVRRIVEVHDGANEMNLPMSTAERINGARRRYLGKTSWASPRRTGRKGPPCRCASRNCGEHALRGRDMTDAELSRTPLADCCAEIDHGD
jgi:hypothetical protein